MYRYKYKFSLSHIDNMIIENANHFQGDILFLQDDYDGLPTDYYFTSPHLNSLDDYMEVWRRALALLALYNGVNNLLYYPSKENSIKSNLRLARLYDNSSSTITPIYNIDEIVQGVPFDENLTFDAVKTANFKVDLIQKSKEQIDLKNILLQLGSDLGWINLYCIFDTLKYYSKRYLDESWANVRKKAGLEQSDEKAFTGTVNNFGVLGIRSRHGDLGYKIPQQIVSLVEAQNIILKLTRAYIRIRLGD